MQGIEVEAFYRQEANTSHLKSCGAKIYGEAIPAVFRESSIWRATLTLRTMRKLARLAGIAILCLGLLSLASADSVQSKRKQKKQELPPLPSGPTGPVPPIPLDAIAPVAPQVTYQDGLLTIIANNSTLGDILRAVRKQTSAEIEIPDAKERVVTHLGPAPAREVIAALLNGSRFNYVLLGSPLDPNALTRVVLVAKTGLVNGGSPQQFAQPMNQAAVPTPQGETPRDDAAEMNSDDDTTEDAAPVQAEQPPPPQDQPEVKTPQQLLQEMQQRQLQMQQQQQGQPGNPPGPPPAPPQQQ
jgi:hypothetical protein